MMSDFSEASAVEAMARAIWIAQGGNADLFERHMKDPTTRNHWEGYAQAALAALKPFMRGGWQDMATAPNGTMMLCSMSPTIEAKDWCWVDWIADGQPRLFPKRKATHWMRLPASPSPPDVKEG